MNLKLYIIITSTTTTTQIILSWLYEILVSFVEDYSKGMRQIFAPYNNQTSEIGKNSDYSD